MAEPEVEQKLAAILAADAADYTRLMADDETATLVALDAARAIFREHIATEHGRIVDTAGDSVLATFATATGAVRATIAVQAALARAEGEVPEHRRMRFRIGVHLGEVMEKTDGSIYGDGVNLAARLEGLAAPGGVCISTAVSEQIAGRIDEPFVDIGEHSVKNVAKPVHVFAWGGGPCPAPAPKAERGLKPTVAIGAFEGISGGDASTLLAGACDGIVAALSNQTGLVMVPDAAHANYVVDSTLQVLGKRYRATVRVLDRDAGQHFVSDRFDGELDDAFQAQDDLAYRIYNLVRFAVYDREYQTAGTRPGAEQATETLLSKAGRLIANFDFASYAQARAMLETVIAREPENFMALTLIAVTHLANVKCGYKPILPEDGMAALENARRAVHLNPTSDYAHMVLAQVHLDWQGDREAARRESERSLEVNPYYALGMHFKGLALICDDRAEEGLALCMKATEANPRMPHNHWFMQSAALGEFVLQHYEAAIDAAVRSGQHQAEVARTLLILAAASALGGKGETARRSAERLLARHPEFRIRDLGIWPFRDPAIGERLVEGLRLAGLPE